ncbi:MAG: hypothetical protein K2Q33_00455 [Gammaproteobacteria bacterium]|nr:hypothetical protein [Gammaproteobacteria bacterium]
MAPNAGAFPERLANRPWTWLYEVNNSAMDLVDTLCQIREQYFKNGLAPEVIESPYKGERYVEEFYKKEYLQSL